MRPRLEHVLYEGSGRRSNSDVLYESRPRIGIERVTSLVAHRILWRSRCVLEWTCTRAIGRRKCDRPSELARKDSPPLVSSLRRILRSDGTNVEDETTNRWVSTIFGVQFCCCRITHNLVSLAKTHLLLLFVGVAWSSTWQRL